MSARAASRPSVVLVDDHDALRRGLELLLEVDGLEVVGSAGTTREALEVIAALRPDVAIVDIHLGADDGLELIGRALALDPWAGFVVYTGSDDPEQLERAVASGARGLVAKTAPRDELVAVVRTVAQGGVQVAPSLRHAPRGLGRPVLSPREREILELLAVGRTSEQVAGDLYLSNETVRTHMRNAMRKLGARTRAQAVAQAMLRHEIAA